MFFILNLLLFNSIQKDALKQTNIHVLLWKIWEMVFEFAIRYEEHFPQIKKITDLSSLELTLNLKSIV